jgi:molybdopterin molybdotransferase
VAEDIVARVTQPLRRRSAMDGYAVRAADVAKVPVQPAFDTHRLAMPLRRSCSRTGGSLLAVRRRRRCVVIQEDTIATGDQVEVRVSVIAGRRFAAGDFTKAMSC